MIEIGQMVKYKVGKWDLDQDVRHQNYVGDIVPLLVTRVWSHEYGDEPGVNGRAFLDGEAILWVTSMEEIEPGIWGHPDIEQYL